MKRATPHSFVPAAALGSFALAALAAAAPGATWTVCPSGCDSPTIQGAINLASTGDEIVLATSGPITEADIFVLESVEIRSLPGQTVTVQAAATAGTASSRVFFVPSGVSAVLRGLEIRHGKTSGDGGGILNQGELVLVDVDVFANEVGSQSTGGGIRNDGTLRLIASDVMVNSGGNGGGVHNAPGATLEAVECSISGNVAQGDSVSESRGGNLFNEGTATLVDCRLSNGSALANVLAFEVGRGGGIFTSGDLLLDGVYLSFNEAEKGSGGAIYQSGGDTVARHSRIQLNAASQGAGVHIAGGSFAGHDLDISHNVAGSSGGGLFLGSGAARLIRGTVEENSANRGGGLFSASSTAPQLSNVTVTGNGATDEGGGLYIRGSRRVDIASSTIVANVAGGKGGGIRLGTECTTAICFPARAQLRGSIVANNSGFGAADDCSGELSSEGFNLLENVSSGTIGECRVSGDLTGVVLGADPLLEAVADNGGPGLPNPGGPDSPSRTHALLPGSPAIDAGDPNGCDDQDGTPLPTDQRLALRVGRCDMGAFEHGGTPPGAVIFVDGFESGDTVAWSG